MAVSPPLFIRFSYMPRYPLPPVTLPPSVSLGPEAVLVADARPEVPAALQTDDERSLLALIDGKRTVAEILRVSRLSGFVAMRQLRSLSERKIIRPLSHRGAHAAAPIAPAAPPRVTQRLRAPARGGFTQDLTAVAESFTEPAFDTPTPLPIPRAAPVAQAAPAARRALTPRQLPARATPDAVPEARVVTRELVPVSPPTAVIVPPPTSPLSKGLPRLSPLAAEAVELWLTLAKRQWSTLVVIPAHRLGSAVPLAAALAEAGAAFRRRPVEMLSAEGKDLIPTTEWVFPRTPGDEHSRVIALDPVAVNPMGIPVAQAAGAVLIVAEKGVADLATVRRTVEAIGRQNFVGSVLLSSKPIKF